MTAPETEDRRSTPPSGTGTSLLRTALAAVGVGLGLWGLWLLLHSLTPDALLRLPLWLGGAALVDDLLLVPVTIAAGWVLTRWSAGPGRQRLVTPIRTTGLYVGVTTLVALPLLLRQGEGPNPTVLPRNYLRDWLLLEATIVAVGLIVLAVRLVRARRPSRPRRVRPRTTQARRST